MVVGSSMYNVRVTIAPVAKSRWTSICDDVSGSVGSLVELLQGKLSKSVMERVCRKADGLFPSPQEIKLSCSCPDGAYCANMLPPRCTASARDLMKSPLCCSRCARWMRKD